MMYRVRRCFKSKSTADTYVARSRKIYQGFVQSTQGSSAMVLKCRKGCPCGPGRKECGKNRPD